MLLRTFAVAALVLAAIGVYSLTSYSVQQRTQEIGIYVALGATPRVVRTMVIRQGLTLVVIGIAIGGAVSFGVTRLIAALLFGVTGRDPLVFTTASVLLLLVAVAGVWAPARRAASVDPMVALRDE